MEHFNRRELLGGLIGLAGSLALPTTAEAHGDTSPLLPTSSQQGPPTKIRPADLVNLDIDDPSADLNAFRERFGADLKSVSRVLKNRTTHESVRFLTFDNGSIQWLYTGEPGAYVPFAHRHEEDEIYNVVSGAIDVCIDGQWQTARAGETLTIPAMAMHEANNPYNEPVEMLVTFDPDDEDIYLAGKAYWLACDLGWTNENGTADMFKLFKATRALDTKAYPKGMPKWLIDLLMG